MAKIGRTFRVFVSSTFSDLKEERNALQKDVFPRLRDLCVQHGCRFQAIDLRWGVREEAALDQQTMKICFEEIARCQEVTPRPNFIVLLGDKYGWCPLPHEIPLEEFEEIERNIENEADRSMLSNWYRRDDNAVPPVFDLQPRRGKYIDLSEWVSVENQLRSIFLQAIKKIQLDHDAFLKHGASATEQEIVQGALQVQDASEHVFCFFRSILVPQKNGSLSFVKKAPLDKKFRDFVNLDKKDELDMRAYEQLYELKERLNDLLPGNIYKYEAQWTGESITTGHLKKLCDDVYKSLSKIILNEIAKLEEIIPLEREIADHEAFGRERSKYFIGRASVLETISEYLKVGNTHPLVVFGESGTGKTALIGRAVKQSIKNFPQFRIISRFIGATPDSSDGRKLLESLCQQIYRDFNFEEQKQDRMMEIEGYDEKSQEQRRRIEEEYEIPMEFQKLSATFQDFLFKIPENCKLILFLDALDQLAEADQARNLFWIPSKLPENVNLIVSTLPGECLTILEKKLPGGNLVELLPMPMKEGKKLLDLWFKDAGRTLQGHQQREVIKKFSSNGLPLYLKLAFEQARKWKSYTERIELNPDLIGIIIELLEDLSSDSNHGKIMVSRSLGYLSSAKKGLTEDELLDVLSIDEDVLQDFIQRAYHEPPEKKLPIIVWSRLFFDLNPYLTERTADGASLLAFYHRQFADVVMSKFLRDKEKKKRHKSLARYFSSLDLWIKKDSKKTPHLRKVSELPFQQTHANIWDELEQTLCDLHFIEAKCAAGMTYDLIKDYNLALNALPEAQDEKRREIEHQKRIEKYVNDLIAYSKSWSEARKLNTNNPEKYPMPKKEDIPLPEIIASVKPWTKEEIRQDTERIINNPNRLERIRAFSQFVNSESHSLVKYSLMPGFCLQQAYNSANSGPVVKSAEVLISAEVDEILLLNESSQRSEYSPHPALIKTLEGHKDNIWCVSITPDGRRAISGSNDNTLRVWDIESGKCLKTLKGHKHYVTSVDITPDGKWGISGGWEGTLRVWDLDSDECIKIFEDSLNRSPSVSITPDGSRAISGGQGKKLRVWDIENGKCLKSIEGHKDKFSGVITTADGRKAISESWDGTLRIWDIEKGQCLNTIVGPAKSTSNIRITPDGKIAIVGYSDYMLRVWDTENGECLKTLEGHTSHITSISITADGKRAISGSEDKTLCIWEIESGECIKISMSLEEEVFGVSITSDGKRVITGSRDGRLRVWDIERGEFPKRSEGHTESISCLTITPDGRKVISGSHDNTLRVWEIDSGECLTTLKGHRGYVEDVDILPDGRRVISGSWDNTLRIWDVENGKCLKILEGHTFSIYCLTITPDGRRAISKSNDQELRIWDIESGECLKTLSGSSHGTGVARITPDGKKAISGGYGPSLRVWDIERGESLKILSGHRGILIGVNVTSDGKRVISGSQDDKNLRVWDIESGKCLKTLKGHTSHLSCLTITPDGRRAISGDIDKVIRVWDIEGENCLKILEGHADRINSVNITPDGKYIISIGSDDTLRVWDIERGELHALYRSSISNLSTNANSNVVCSTYTEEVVILGMHNLTIAPPIVSSTRIWLHSQNDKGKWDDDIKTNCLWCGQRFIVASKILNVIKAITKNANLSPDQSPCLDLPAEAWDEPGLLSECPSCHKPLKFNPFIVDNRDRY